MPACLLALPARLPAACCRGRHCALILCILDTPRLFPQAPSAILEPGPLQK
jgi:hypothetical protein